MEPRKYRQNLSVLKTLCRFKEIKLNISAPRHLRDFCLTTEVDQTFTIWIEITTRISSFKFLSYLPAYLLWWFKGIKCLRWISVWLSLYPVYNFHEQRKYLFICNLKCLIILQLLFLLSDPFGWWVSFLFVCLGSSV